MMNMNIMQQPGWEPNTANNGPDVHQSKPSAQEMRQGSGDMNEMNQSAYANSQINGINSGK